jgi:hypothetical protein
VAGVAASTGTRASPTAIGGRWTVCRSSCLAGKAAPEGSKPSNFMGFAQRWVKKVR